MSVIHNRRPKDTTVSTEQQHSSFDVCIPWELIEDRALPHTAIRIYGGLAFHSDDRRQATIGVRPLAKTLGMSAVTVMKGISALEERAWVTTVRGQAVDGSHITNRYELAEVR